MKMVEKAVKHWLAKQVDRIGKDALSIKPCFFPETIHHFRTSTKRLRAIIRLTGTEEGETAKLPPAFRKLYQVAGDLRDRQVLLQMIVEDKQHTLPLFALWLSHQIGAAGHSLGRKHPQKALHQMEEYVAQLKTELELPALQRFYTEHLERIKSLMRPYANDEALHEVRKLAKDLEYVLDWCRKKWEEGFQLLAPIEEKLEQLSDKAGAYNDRRNLLNMLKQFKIEYRSAMNEEDIASAARAGKDWVREKAGERKALLTAIRRLTSLKIVPLQDAEA